MHRICYFGSYLPKACKSVGEPKPTKRDASLFRMSMKGVEDIHQFDRVKRHSSFQACQKLNAESPVSYSRPHILRFT